MPVRDSWPITKNKRPITSLANTTTTLVVALVILAIVILALVILAIMILSHVAVFSLVRSLL